MRKLFTGPAPAARRGGEEGAVEAAVERLDSQVAEVAVALQPRGRERQREPEAAGVAEPELAPRVEGEDQVLVRLGRRFARRHRQPAAHAEVHDEGRSPLEVGEQELGPPPQRGHAPPQDPAAQCGGRHRLAQPAVSHLQAHDPPPHQVRLEAAAQDLDLGQLGHGRILGPGRS